ncbi:MAG: hypothetical protein DHS20C16_22170 [Phycisphaerae bacterium]|nr:MAG: hypothetical protein DHS20C16_22170 [Phycisphaerae bacterium]
MNDPMNRRLIGILGMSAAAFGILVTGGCVEPLPQALAPETARVAIQSQCAQNVINCTTSWPEAVISVEAIGGQTVSLTDTGFLVEGSDGNGQETVRLVGTGSVPGDGATIASFEWSSGATDEDPTTLAAGTVFSDDSTDDVPMGVGFHYIRLTVKNDIIRDLVVSDEFGLLFQDVPSFDFVELEIEVRD